MELRNLQDVFTHELKDMYSAEKMILKALPDMVKAVENSKLKSALEEHRRITETQVDRLEQILAELDESIKSTKKCKGMEGILEEGKDLLKGNGSSKVGNGALDSALIGAAQKVEHYEIAAYGTLVAFAKQLGNEEAAELLEESLGEEKEADEKLTQIASSINVESANGDSETEGRSASRGAKSQAASRAGSRTRGAMDDEESMDEGSRTSGTNQDDDED